MKWLEENYNGLIDEDADDEYKGEKNLLYPELSYKILEIAFEVHNQLGPGFTEDIY